jgi:RNA polymerase sigma factor (sigma-70 family)
VAADASDVVLRQRMVAGDDDALAEIYDRWAALVRTVALRITDDHSAADDVTQDVFVQLWQRPESFDPARGTLRTWLCLTARGRALDWIRRRRVRIRYDTAAAAEATVNTNEVDVEESAIWRAETKVVREAVQALPEAQRSVILLAYYCGHTYREVAKLLEIPEGTAKSRLRVALATLAQRLDAEGFIER